MVVETSLMFKLKLTISTSCNAVLSMSAILRLLKSKHQLDPHPQIQLLTPGQNQNRFLAVFEYKTGR